MKWVPGGVRVDLQSVDKSLTDSDPESLLQQYADAIRPLNRVLQLYVPLHAMVIAESIAPQLQAPACASTNSDILYYRSRQSTHGPETHTLYQDSSLW
jgi:hypothetical protein